MVWHEKDDQHALGPRAGVDTRPAIGRVKLGIKKYLRLQYSRTLVASILALCIAFLVTARAATPLLAGTKIEVNYAVTYLHVTIGSGRWQIEVSGGQYLITASGRVKGMMSVLINGKGSGFAEGVLSKDHMSASRFDAEVVSTAEDDRIEMAMQSGAVKTLSALPPFPAVPKRVPVTANLLQDVIDPLSAAPAFVSGDSDDERAACERRLPIFDGRRRYDANLAFKRAEAIVIPPIYRGAGIVCSARLVPIAGHQVDSTATKYLIESNDLEVEFAFIPQARVIVPVGANIPTLIGTVHVVPEQIHVDMSSDIEDHSIPYVRH
jgi:hypothetical protein